MVHPLHRRRQAMMQAEADKVKAEVEAAQAAKKPVAKKKTTKKAKTDK